MEGAPEREATAPNAAFGRVSTALSRRTDLPSAGPIGWWCEGFRMPAGRDVASSAAGRRPKASKEGTRGGRRRPIGVSDGRVHQRDAGTNRSTLGDPTLFGSRARENFGECHADRHSPDRRLLRASARILSALPNSVIMLTKTLPVQPNVKSPDMAMMGPIRRH